MALEWQWAGEPSPSPVGMYEHAHAPPEQSQYRVVVAVPPPPVGGPPVGGGVGEGGPPPPPPPPSSLVHHLPPQPDSQFDELSLHQSPPWTSRSHVELAPVPRGPQLQYPANAPGNGTAATPSSRAMLGWNDNLIMMMCNT